MCKGTGKDGRPCPVIQSCAAAAEISSSPSCELCDSNAAVYCHADDAFLCRKCDRWVHGANFLAQRHIRCLICGPCGNLTNNYLIGKSLQVILPTLDENFIQRLSQSQSQCGEDLDPSTCAAGEVKKPFLFL